MESEPKQQVERKSRLAWLMRSWDKKSLEINQLNAEARGVKPSLFQKIKGLLNQIAFLRRRETDIVSEINEIEKKHRYLRAHNKLRHFKPQEFENKKKSEAKQRRNFWWILLFLLFFMKKDTTKKQELNLS